MTKTSESGFYCPAVTYTDNWINDNRFIGLAYISLKYYLSTIRDEEVTTFSLL